MDKNKKWFFGTLIAAIVVGILLVCGGVADCFGGDGETEAEQGYRPENADAAAFVCFAGMGSADGQSGGHDGSGGGFVCSRP